MWLCEVSEGRMSHPETEFRLVENRVNLFNLLSARSMCSWCAGRAPNPGVTTVIGQWIKSRPGNTGPTCKKGVSGRGWPAKLKSTSSVPCQQTYGFGRVRRAPAAAYGAARTAMLVVQHLLGKWGVRDSHLRVLRDQVYVTSTKIESVSFEHLPWAHPMITRSDTLVNRTLPDQVVDLDWDQVF